MIVKPRSLDQHKRFFGLIRAAFDQWPESYKAFQPDTPEHLRAWLLVKAKYRTIKHFSTPNATVMATMIPIVIAVMTGKHAWAWEKDGDLYVCVPESIAFDSLGHNAFCVLNDDVEEIIRVETGLDPEALLREKAA